ncbi:MAG: hypothetical protein JWN15_4178 [Firmicutes bacterium]|nr:hypothetical protein [Bacillota bacterium]
MAEARALYQGQPGCTDPEWYWLGSLVYWHLEEYLRSRGAAEYGLSLKPSGEIRIKLLQRLGSTEEQLGAYGEAIEHLEACLAELPEHPSLAGVLTGPLLHNLGLAYYNRNGKPENLRQAAAYYERAVAELRREGLKKHLLLSLWNLAWTLCDLNQPDRAADLIDEAAPLCATESDRAMQQVMNAYQLLAAGDCARCLDTLQSVIHREDGSSAFILGLSVMALAAIGMRYTDPGMIAASEHIIYRAFVEASMPGVDLRCWTTAKRVRHHITQVIQEQRQGA